MSDQLSASATRVQDFLSAKGFSFKVKQLASSTRTAQEAADTIGCSVAQIAKSLIFKDGTSGQPVLIVASGTNRVNVEKVSAETGISLLKANADFVKKNIGYAIGGVPPIAHTNSVTTLLDPDLKKFDIIWAAAGTPNAVFCLRPSDLDQLTNGQWVVIAE